MAYVPNRGDVIHLEFDPASGQEMKGRHFGLVLLSGKVFNRQGLAMVCPISQGAAGVDLIPHSFLPNLMRDLLGAVKVQEQGI